MQRLLTFFIFCISFVHAGAQPSDFIVLKKNNRTIKTFFTGSQINFTAASGANVEAIIKSIRNDTLFLKGFIVRALPTQMGFYILDTAYYYSQYHYNQIHSFPKEGRHFNWGSSGALLFGGGILLTAANGVVYLADNKRFSPELLGTSAALTGIGYLLMKSAGKGMVIGKKYSLLYVHAADKKR